MQTIAIASHIFICIFLIAVILLQAGKGADVGAVFGGASQTLFGGRGPATFLNKLTIIISVFFLITSVWLTKLGQNKAGESVLGKITIEKKEPAVPGAETVPGSLVKVLAWYDNEIGFSSRMLDLALFVGLQL